MGSSSHPDPFGPGGADRIPAVNDFGKPCAREAHARFEGGRWKRGRSGGPLRSRAGELRNATTMAWSGPSRPVTRYRASARPYIRPREAEASGRPNAFIRRVNGSPTHRPVSLNPIVCHTPWLSSTPHAFTNGAMGFVSHSSSCTSKGTERKPCSKPSPAAALMAPGPPFLVPRRLPAAVTCCAIGECHDRGHTDSSACSHAAMTASLRTMLDCRILSDRASSS